MIEAVPLYVCRMTLEDTPPLCLGNRNSNSYGFLECYRSDVCGQLLAYSEHTVSVATHYLGTRPDLLSSCLQLAMTSTLSSVNLSYLSPLCLLRRRK
jgi:hypothetical protein